jgi:hypothetical protein
MFAKGPLAKNLAAQSPVTKTGTPSIRASIAELLECVTKQKALRKES